MARSGSDTAEKARAAFIDLIRQRERPTAAKIRAIIGGGGTDLIQRVIREMEDDLYAKQFDLSNRPDVPAVLVDSITHLWNQANNLADERFNAAKIKLEAIVTSMQESIDTLTASEKQLLAENESIKTQLESTSAQLSAAEAHGVELTNLLRIKTDEAIQARREADERINDAKVRLAEQIGMAEERYRGLEKHLLENFDRERMQINRHVDELKGALDKLSVEKKALDESLKRANEDRALLLGDRSALRTLIETLRGEASLLVKERGEAKSLVATLEKKLMATEKQLESWKRRARAAIR